MKTIVAAMVTCIALFGLSMGATQFLLTSSERPETPETETESESTEEAAEGETEKFDAQSIPVSFRPETVSVEAVVQMSDSIRKMEQQLVEREKRVRKDEQRVAMMFADLETEREELLAFSEGIDSKVDAVQKMTNSLSNQLNELETQKEEIKLIEKAAGADPESKLDAMDEKVNHVKSWFAGLAPEQAADYLKEFANNGKLEFAASLLHKMPDRQKSKILGSMKDPVLVDQLIDALSTRPKK